MANKNGIDSRRNRLREIEDRKLAILLEFGHINKRIVELILELSKLDKEYYELWLESN
jgi:hypothetical protein